MYGSIAVVNIVYGQGGRNVIRLKGVRERVSELLGSASGADVGADNALAGLSAEAPWSSAAAADHGRSQDSCFVAIQSPAGSSAPQATVIHAIVEPMTAASFADAVAAATTAGQSLNDADDEELFAGDCSPSFILEASLVEVSRLGLRQGARCRLAAPLAGEALVLDRVVLQPLGLSSPPLIEQLVRSALPCTVYRRGMLLQGATGADDGVVVAARVLLTEPVSQGTVGPDTQFCFLPGSTDPSSSTLAKPVAQRTVPACTASAGPVQVAAVRWTGHEGGLSPGPLFAMAADTEQSARRQSASLFDVGVSHVLLAQLGVANGAWVELMVLPACPSSHTDRDGCVVARAVRLRLRRLAPRDDAAYINPLLLFNLARQTPSGNLSRHRLLLSPMYRPLPILSVARAQCPPQQQLPPDTFAAGRVTLSELAVDARAPLSGRVARPALRAYFAQFPVHCFHDIIAVPIRQLYSDEDAAWRDYEEEAAAPPSPNVETDAEGRRLSSARSVAEFDEFVHVGGPVRLVYFQISAAEPASLQMENIPFMVSLPNVVLEASVHCAAVSRVPRGARLFYSMSCSALIAPPVDNWDELLDSDGEYGEVVGGHDDNDDNDDDNDDDDDDDELAQFDNVVKSVLGTELKFAKDVLFSERGPSVDRTVAPVAAFPLPQSADNSAAVPRLLLYGAWGTGKTLLARRLALVNGAQKLLLVEFQCTAANAPKSLDDARAHPLIASFVRAQGAAPHALLLIRRLDLWFPGEGSGDDGPDEAQSEHGGGGRSRPFLLSYVFEQCFQAQKNASGGGSLRVVATAQLESADELPKRRPRLQQLFQRALFIAPPHAQQRALWLRRALRGVDHLIDVRTLGGQLAGANVANLHGAVRSGLLERQRRLLKHSARRSRRHHLPLKPHAHDVCGPDTLKLAGFPVLHQDFEPVRAQVAAATARRVGAPSVPNVRWSDVGGLAEARSEITDAIELPLRHPELFAEAADGSGAARRRSGLLLYGPPGSGKTLLAKAVATELQLNFMSVKGPELLNMYVGESERNVREVFALARSAAPCVIFFDEIDALAPARGHASEGGGVMDRIVSQLLAEMDGMNTKGDVFVLGATNRPDLLDSALLRPGRFDRMIYLGIDASLERRVNILTALTRQMPVHPAVNLKRVAAMCPERASGADLYAICSQAFMAAVREIIHGMTAVPAKPSSASKEKQPTDHFDESSDPFNQIDGTDDRGDDGAIEAVPVTELGLQSLLFQLDEEDDEDDEKDEDSENDDDGVADKHGRKLKSNQTDEPTVLVEERHFQVAAQSCVPSVSPQELARYDELKSKYA